LEKEAKTFATALAGERRGKSFLVLFFKKEPLPFERASWRIRW
jgi:hypothetical protein